MFISWNNPCVRLTGRWSRIENQTPDPHIFRPHTCECTTTTAAGSYIEIAFAGTMALLEFDTGYSVRPFPHLWISVDNGAKTETAVDRFIRICTKEDGNHIIKVCYKGGMEDLPRWYRPLMGQVSFKGFYAPKPGFLPADNRKIIEFLGDSITEGVLADADYTSRPDHLIDQLNRPYQDDNDATYASLTAAMLNLRPIFQAYGAVGMARSGCGCVPRAGLIYPFVFDGIPYTGERPDYIVINFGANDRQISVSEYISRYEEYLTLVRSLNPNAAIVCLSPFCGIFDEDIKKMVFQYNADHHEHIYFISGKGWVPSEPLHPLRDGHKIIAQHLVSSLKNIIHETMFSEGEKNGVQS